MQTHLRSIPLYRFCVLFVIVLLASSELVLSTNYPIFRGSNKQWISFPSILSQSEIHYYYIKFSLSRTHAQVRREEYWFQSKEWSSKRPICYKLLAPRKSFRVFFSKRFRWVCVERSPLCVNKESSDRSQISGGSSDRNLFDSIETARLLQVPFSLIHSCCERAILTEHTPKTHKRYRTLHYYPAQSCSPCYSLKWLRTHMLKNNHCEMSKSWFFCHIVLFLTRNS